MGAFLGAVVGDDWEGGVFGLILGYLFGAHLQLKGSILALQRELKSIKTNLLDSHVDIGKDSVQTKTEEQANTLSKSQLQLINKLYFWINLNSRLTII